MSVPVTKFCISAPSVSFHLLHDTGAGNSGTAFTRYQLVYYAALSAVVWMMVVVQRGDQRGVQGVKGRKELYEASCLFPILGSSCYLRWQFPPIISLADPVCAFSEMLGPAVWRPLYRDGSFSSVGFLLQASEFYSGQPLSIVSPPKVAAVSCSCYFMFCFCLFSHVVNNSVGYIFSVKYLVYNSCILTGSHWRQWIGTKSLIMVPMPPKSVSQTLPELLNIFPSHLISLLELKFL